MRGFVALFLVSALVPAAVADKITSEIFQSRQRTRQYFLYVPDTVAPDAEAPLLVLLHGSGRDGKSLVEPWKDIAKRERLILAGPTATDRAQWDMKNDGPYFIADLIDVVRSTHKIDLRRLYIFGHSAGAIQGLMLGLLESEYFAAVAVHAGALPKEAWNVIDLADRKIPLAIWVGTNDRFFPVEAVKATKAAIDSKGIPVHLRLINNHTHNYYQRSGEVNAEAWAFLQQHRLDRNPRFKDYDFR